MQERRVTNLKKQYVTEVVLARSLDTEPVVVYRLTVYPDDARPFAYLFRTVSGANKQNFWHGSGNYYSLGTASRRMLEQANRHARANNLIVASMSYSDTAILVRDLPDFYKVTADGTVKEVR